MNRVHLGLAVVLLAAFQASGVTVPLSARMEKQIHGQVAGTVTAAPISNSELLFRGNHRRGPLSRFGVRYILAKYCTRAREAMPTLATKRLHPHSMRHSTAVHLLRSGVDIVTISQWLGHASVTPTNRYATVDLEMKRKAIEQAGPVDDATAGLGLWRTDASILTWLEAL
jgi:site-specific recombinase XerD